MIGAKILALFGLYVPSMSDERHLVTAMRRADAAAFQQKITNRNAQTVALDHIEAVTSDERPRQMAEDAEKMKETLSIMLGRLK